MTDQYFGKRTRQTVGTDENNTIQGMMIRTVWICPTIQRVPHLSFSLALCIALLPVHRRPPVVSCRRDLFSGVGSGFLTLGKFRQKHQVESFDSRPERRLAPPLNLNTQTDQLSSHCSLLPVACLPACLSLWQYVSQLQHHCAVLT